MLYTTYGPILASEYGTSITSFARTGMSGSAPVAILSRLTGIATLLPLASLRISVASDPSAAYIAPPADPTAPSTVSPEPTEKKPGRYTHPVTITLPPPGTTTISPGSTGIFMKRALPVMAVAFNGITTAGPLVTLFCKSWSVGASGAGGTVGESGAPACGSLSAATLTGWPASAGVATDCATRCSWSPSLLTCGRMTTSSAASGVVPPAWVITSRIDSPAPLSVINPGGRTAPTTATCRLLYSLTNRSTCGSYIYFSSAVLSWSRRSDSGMPAAWIEPISGKFILPSLPTLTVRPLRSSTPGTEISSTSPMPIG